MAKSKLTSQELKELYLQGKTLAELAPLAGIGEVAVWKRLHSVNTPMRPAHTHKNWAIEKGGKEFLGSDGRVWISGIRSTKRRGSKRKAVVIMEKKLGKPIPPGYHVHHRDGDKVNDDPNNLQILSMEDHNKISSRQRRVPRNAP